jgi:hypothetical protein
MDPEKEDVTTTYVLALEKAPLLLMGTFIFAVFAWKCWNAYLAISPTEQEE